MKKILIIVAAAIVAFGSCGKGSAPSANLNDGLDSLSYEVGVINAQNIKQYLAGQGIDEAYIDEFCKGVAEAAQAGDDKQQAAYFAGIQAGQQMSQVYSALNLQLFGNDSTNEKHANLQQIVAGFIDATKGKAVITPDLKDVDKKVNSYKDQYLAKNFGDNKKKSEDFIAQKAKEEGIQKLPGGTLYRVLAEGSGPKPAKGDKVQVTYEGRLVDGTVFDGSEKNNEGKPTEIQIEQMIAAWQEALPLMSEGSEWELYVPYDQAYGNRELSLIKPYSALIFKVKLVKAKSDISIQ